MATELTAESTTEDIKAHVEEVAKEVAEERAGEQAEKKSDAQITSEHASTKQPAHSATAEATAEQETPAETDGTESHGTESQTGNDTAPTGEETAEAETGETSDGQQWLTDDVKAEAAAYGIEESEIADFASREEFDRALRLFDKSAMEAGRKAMADMAEAEGEGDKAQVRNEKGQFTKKEEPKTEDQPKQVEGQYEVALDKDVYDEDIVVEFTRMRDHYESRLGALESRLVDSERRFVEADARAEEQHFDSLVDNLGHADLFGKTDEENAKQLQRRKDLMVAVKAQQIGLEQLGRPTELTESLISRVSRMVFAEELGRKDLKKRTRKISKQADSRQGGGATRPQDPREDPRDEADRLYRELERA